MGAVCCRPTPIDFDGEVNLFHFVLLRCVGKGAFGKVRVVQHKQSRELYALKYINKVSGDGSRIACSTYPSPGEMRQDESSCKRHSRAPAARGG